MPHLQPTVKLLVSISNDITVYDQTLSLADGDAGCYLELKAEISIRKQKFELAAEILFLKLKIWTK